jgi:hypothetical protein
VGKALCAVPTISRHRYREWWARFALPTIHSPPHSSIFRNSAFATFSSVERGMSSTK